MVNLLLHYFYELYSGSDTFIELYMRGTLQIVRSYDKFRKGALPQANYLLMKILTIKNKRIYNSSFMVDIVR